MRPLADPDLVQAYLDGELTPEQITALEERLRSEPALADTLIRLGREDAILTEWAHSARACQASENGEAILPLPALRRRKRSLRLVAAAFVASAAAALLLAFLGASSLFHKERPAPRAELARLEEVQGDVFVVPEAGEPFPATSGQALGIGQGLSTHGDGSFAVLAFPDTSRLELGADTTIRMPTTAPGKQIYLEQGTVAADVAPQPADQPMIVATPHAEARFLETRSNFASTSAETRIESEKGKVQLTRKSDGRTLDVPTGWYAIAAAASNQFDAKPLPTLVVQPRSILSEVVGPALSVALSPDGATLAIGGTDGSIKLWDLATSTIRLTLSGHKRGARSLAFAPVGKLLACGYDDRMVRLWDPVTGTELGCLKDVRAQTNALAFAPNVAVLATAGSLGKGSCSELHLWDVAARQELVAPREQVVGAIVLAFSPDGRTLATAGSKDNGVKLWDVALRQVRQTLAGHTGQVKALAFSPDGRLLVSGGKDRSVKLWNLTTNMEERTLPMRCCEVRALAFAPDGRLAVGADQNVTLWDVGTGRERLIFRGHKHAISTMLFAEDGRTLVTVGWDKTVRLWDVMGE
jgi:WD40 repeat protein